MSCSEKISYLIKLQLLEKAAGAQETSAVGGSVVLEADSEAVLLELLGVSSADNLVTDDLSLDHLHCNILVREANDKTVLGGLVLVLVLGDELVPLAVIGVSRSSSCKLDLVPLEVGLVLDNFDERLK